MQLHELQPKNRAPRSRRIGRGGKKGTYSGRGTKGQKARAGRKFKPIIRDMIKRYHKLRGYRFSRVSPKPLSVNVSELEKKFSVGEVVTPRTLVEKGLVPRAGGRIPHVKILGRGELSKKIEVKGCEVSDSARKKITEQGGTVQ